MVKSILYAAVALAILLAFTCSPTVAAPGNVRPGSVVVHPALGGAILGYDVDQNGTEGILSEYFTLPNGNSNVAVETFDQATGKIIKIVKQQKNTLNDFAAYPVTGSGVGLVLFQKHTHDNRYKNTYKVLNPLSSNKFTSAWTPHFGANKLLWSISESQGQPTTALMVIENGGNAETHVLSTNVAANTFGPEVPLTDPIFAFNNSPVMAFDTATTTAVVASSNACRACGTELALADLVHGTVTEFAGLGLGFVNGIAVDSTDGIATTTTEIDFGVEFYNLAKQTGFEVLLPNATSQEQSGADVEYDPINKLFLVAQPVSSTGSGSSVQVFDTKGKFVESINNLNLPVSPVLIALNPNTRVAFMVEAPAGTALQSFAY